MIDPFENHKSGLQSPATGALLITPNDAADLPVLIRGLNVAGAGAVRVTMLSGNTVTLHIEAGGILPIRVRRVHATETTAKGIVGLW